MNDTKENNRPNRPTCPVGDLDEPPTLAFGRYARQPLDTISRPYLQWLLAFDVDGDELRAAIRRHLTEAKR